MDPMQQILVEHERCRDHDHPHHLPWGGSTGHAIFLRRTHPELNDVVKRAHRIFRVVDPAVRWNENKHTFTFSSGFIYQFGHCHDKNDWANYFGFEFSWIGWDELIMFEEEQYDQINSRLRSSDPVLRKMLKIRAMTNPMMQRKQGENFSVTDPNWVRRRFVDPAPEGKVTLVKKIRMDDGSFEQWTSIYMPALLSDNPDPEFRRIYEINLQQKKPHIRQALLRGDWYTTEGSYFAEEWNPQLHVVKPFDIPKDWPKWRSMDWGFKLPGCVHWWAMDEDGNIVCVREMMFKGMTDEEVAEAIIQVEQGMKWTKGRTSKLTGPADTQIWEQRGDTGKTKAQAMADKGVYWTKADKRSRLRSAELVTARLKDHDGGTATPGIVFFDTCKEIIKLLPAIQTSDKNSEEPADGNDDHPFDSVCVVAGTLVDVPGGKLPIEALRAGDQVLSTDGSYWTCFGGRLTRKNAEVWRVVFEGGEIIATPDHRVLCADGHWWRIDEIDSTCYLFSPWKTLSFSPQPHSCSTVCATTSAVSITRETESDSIDQSGPQRTAQFLRATTSTMWMKIVATIQSVTSSCYSVVSTLFSTPTNSQLTLNALGWTTPGCQPPSGTEALKGSLGTESTPNVRSGNPSPAFQGPVVSAGSHTSTRALALGSGAAERVARDTGEHPALTTWRDFALPAGKRSWLAGTVVKPPVHGDALRVLEVTSFGVADVYCTTVPVMGAFVANGIVVSNCYSASYASFGREGLGWSRKDAEDDDDEKPDTMVKEGYWGYGTSRR
jgi:hypothetical protein